MFVKLIKTQIKYFPDILLSAICKAQNMQDLVDVALNFYNKDLNNKDISELKFISNKLNKVIKKLQETKSIFEDKDELKLL
jgi:SepF-like predicted cell division protein (DUF552 family)